MWANTTLVALSDISTVVSGLASDFKTESETYILSHWLDGALILLFYAILGLTAYLRGGEARDGRPQIFASAKRFLLVTAHPDDETMFFGPTVLGLLSSGAEVFLLCMSTGDYYGRGLERKRELYAACSALGVPEGNVILLHYCDLPDDPGADWDASLVAGVVAHYADLLSTDVVLSFDMGGVSGHPNHTSLGTSLAALPSLLGPSVAVFSLDSVNLLRKYSGPLDALLSRLFRPSATTLASLSSRSTLIRAMEAHASQYVWFRRLFIRLSRYTYINTFTEISHS